MEMMTDLKNLSGFSRRGFFSRFSQKDMVKLNQMCYQGKAYGDMMDDEILKEISSDPEYESADARKVLGIFQRAFVALDELPRRRRMGITKDLTEQLTEIADHLRLGRIGVRFFEGLEEERSNEGDCYDIYNDGKADEEKFIEHRNMTGGFNVVYYRAVLRKGVPEWTERERERVNLLLRIIYVFNGREHLLDVVEKLTFFDTDTGLHNLKYYMSAIGRLDHEGKLGNYSAMRIDMRRFSGVNQQLGRKLGNLVMKRFVKYIEENLAGDEMICRIGGDNFALLVDKDHEDDILDMLEESVIVYNDETEDRIRVSAAVGVYQIPDDGTIHSQSEIMDRITRACQKAKHSKDISITYYDALMVADREQEMKVETAFPQALEDEEFHVFYQPKVDVKTGELHGAEALCRWFRKGEVIPPGQLIPHLERSMAICALDMYMLEHVCRDIRRWLDEGKHVVRVSVNLSRRNLADVDILRHILEIIDRNNVPHEYIEIELTETTMDSRFVDLRGIVSGLQKQGVKTAVDDFGIGFSSLTLIRDLPWDVLKIDRSFLPYLSENESQQEAKKKELMFRSVVNMANGLGMECIVEGVETREQLEIVQSGNCDHVQGFFFDRPMPVEEFEKRMEGTNYGELMA